MKVKPDQSLKFFYTITEAVYHPDSTEIVQKVGGKVLDQQMFMGWKIDIIEKDNKLYAAFRGTTLISNWLHNVERIFHDPKIPGVEEFLIDWEKRSGKRFSGFSGHSGGGWLATRTLENAKHISRVTFNGHKCKRGERNVNLRTENDPLTKGIVGVKNRHITICEGGHSITDFESISDKEWVEISKNFIEASSEGPTIILTPNQQLLSDRLSDSVNSMAYIYKNTADDILILERSEGVQSAMDNLEVSGNECSLEYSKQYNQEPETVVTIFKTAEVVATQLYANSQRKNADLRQKGEVNDLTHAYTASNKANKNSLSQQQSSLSFQAINHQLRSQITPVAIGEDLRKLSQYRQEFDASIHEVRELLKSNSEFTNQITLSQAQLEFTDPHLVKAYKKAFSKQSQYRDFLGKVSGTLSLVNAAFVGPQQAALPVLSSTLAIASMGANILSSASENKSQKLQQKYKDQLEKRKYANDSFTQLLMKKQNERSELNSLRSQQLETVLKHPESFSARQRIAYFEMIKNDNTSEKKKLIESLESKNNDENNIKSELHKLRLAKNKEIAKRESKDKKKKKAKPSSEEIRLATEISVKEADLGRVQDEKKSLGLEIKSFDTSNAAIEKQLKHESAYSASNRVMEELNPVPEQAPIDPNDENKGPSYKERVDRFLEDHESERLKHERQMRPLVEMFNAVDDVARALNMPFLSDLNGLADKSYKMFETYNFWSVSFTKRFDAFKLDVNSKDLNKFICSLGFSGTVTMFIVPGLQFTALAIGALTTIYAIYNRVDRFLKKKQVVTEFDLHMKALNNLSDSLQKAMKTEFENLSDENQLIKEELLTEILSVQQEIGHLDNEISRSIRESTQQLLQRHDKQALVTHLNRINDQKRSIGLEFIKFPQSLKDSKNISCFIEYSMFILKQINSTDLNGFHHTNNLEGALLISESSIQPSDLYRRPEALTGFLASSLNLQSHYGDVPNLALLIPFTKQFLNLTSQNFFLNLLRSDNEKEEFVKICNRLLTLQNSAAQLTSSVASSIGAVFARQQILWTTITTNAKDSRASRKSLALQISMTSLKNYMENKKTVAPVGFSKFYLSDIAKTNFYDPSILGVKKWVPGMDPLADKFRNAINEGNAAASRVFKKRLPRILFKNIIMTVPTAISLISRVSWKGKPKVYPEIFEKFCNTQKTLKDVCTNKNTERTPTHRTNLFLNLESRKITLDPQNATPFIDITIICSYEKCNVVGMNLPDLSDFTVDVAFPDNSNLSQEELLTIPENEIKLSQEEYNTAVKKMIDDHLKRVTAVLTKKENPANNEVVVASLSANLPPLFLPKNLFKQLEKAFRPVKDAMESTGKGVFIPYYKFDEKTGEFIITYKLLHFPDTSKQDEYISFVVAEFDEITCRSFSSKISCKEMSKLEFLLHALKGKKYGLGLPGPGSIILANGLVAPKENDSFEGLISYWEKATMETAKLVYNSALPTPSSDYPNPIYGRHFMITNTSANNYKKDINASEAHYKVDFFLLVALIKLISDIDNDSLLNFLDSLNLPYPDQLDSIYDRWANNNSLKKIDPEILETFMSVINSVPSKTLKTMRKQHRQILKLKESLSPAPVIIEKGETQKIVHASAAIPAVVAATPIINNEVDSISRKIIGQKITEILKQEASFHECRLGQAEVIPETFYESLAQAMNEKNIGGIHHTVLSLREDVSEIVNGFETKDLYISFLKNKNSASRENFKKRVVTPKGGIPIPGNATAEGKLLAEKYGFTLTRTLVKYDDKFKEYDLLTDVITLIKAKENLSSEVIGKCSLILGKISVTHKVLKPQCDRIIANLNKKPLALSNEIVDDLQHVISTLRQQFASDNDNYVVTSCSVGKGKVELRIGFHEQYGVYRPFLPKKKESDESK